MAASFITLFILYATIIGIDSRKLSVSIDGNSLNFRRNILYLTWKDAKDYRILCGPPPGEWHPSADSVFTWTPLTKAGYGTVIPGPNNATLAIRSTFEETVLQFNCTMKVLPNNFEAVTFKIYKTDQYVLTDPAPLASEIRLNYTIGNLSMSPLRLVCRPPSSPQRNLEHSQIVWFLDDVEVKDDEKRKIDTNHGNGTLFIPYAGYADTGVYLCKMKDNMSIFAMYNVTGAAVIPPIFHSWWDSKVVNVGDTATVEHEIFGNPIDPTKIRWQRKMDNKVEDIDDDYFTEDIYKDRLYFNPNIDGPNAQMQLSNIQRTDRSEFIILVENAYGQTNYTTLLRVKAAIDALWPSLGIIIEVVLLIIIIYIFEKRRVKKEAMEDENSNSYGMTVMPNSGEDNLRMRKDN